MQMRGEGAVIPKISTYLEELGDPTKLEGEGEIMFSKVLQYNLGHVGRHVFIRFEVMREAIHLLDFVDATIAKIIDDEHVRWQSVAKEGPPESRIGQARHDEITGSWRDPEEKQGNHHGSSCDKSHKRIHIESRLRHLKRMF